MPLKEFFYTMAFKRKCCIKHPLKEIFLHNALSKKILYTTAFELIFFIQMAFQRKFCKQRPCKENFVCQNIVSRQASLEKVATFLCAENTPSKC